MTTPASDPGLWRGVTLGGVTGEGAAPASDWYAWEAAGHAPRSGDGNGFLDEHRDDLGLLAEAGVTDVRITLEWARIEPAPDRTDAEALDRYHDMVRAAVEVGLRPWITIADTSAPGWFSENERGWRDLRAVGRWWARHVDRVAERFDDVAAGWVPVDDPVGAAVRGHLLGTRPPGGRGGVEDVPEVAADAVAGWLEAQLVGWHLLSSGRQPVMGVFGAPTVHAVTPGADLARRHWDQVLNGSWLGLLSDGELALPGRGVRRSDDWVGAFDLIGLRADPPVGVTDEGRLAPWPVGARTDGSGFAPEPDELSLVLERVHETLGDPTLVVAAHGVTTTDDDWRDELVRRTVAAIEGARHDGIDVRGYVHDTGIDGYDWHRGFAVPRGVVDRDRRPKPSLSRVLA